MAVWGICIPGTQHLTLQLLKEGGEQFLILEYPVLILFETLLISLAIGVGPLGGGQIPIVIFNLISNTAVKGLNHHSLYLLMSNQKGTHCCCIMIEGDFNDSFISFRCGCLVFYWQPLFSEHCVAQAKA